MIIFMICKIQQDTQIKKNKAKIIKIYSVFKLKMIMS